MSRPVESLVADMAAERWELARATCADLLRADPNNHVLNTWMARIVQRTAGSTAALRYASAALDGGFVSAEDSEALAEIFFECDDFVRSTAASAVALLLGGRAPRVTTTKGRIEATQFLVRYLDSGQDRRSGKQLRALHALAVARTGDRLAALRELQSLDDDALLLSPYDCVVEQGLILYSLGDHGGARATLKRRTTGDHPAQALAVLALVVGTESWDRAADLAERSVDEATNEFDRILGRCALSIVCSLGGRSTQAQKVFQDIAAMPLWFNLQRLAHLLHHLESGTVLTSASYALGMQQWDETGGLQMPSAQEALRRLVVSLDAPPRSLSAAQALGRLEPLLVSAPMSWSEGSSVAQVEGAGWWVATDAQPGSWPGQEATTGQPDTSGVEPGTGPAWWTEESDQAGRRLRANGSSPMSSRRG